MKKNPTQLSSNPDDDFALHEFTHSLSAQLDTESKFNFTQEFLRRCPQALKLKRNQIFEEPLAVAMGQMLYLDLFFPDRFLKIKSWYADPWINQYAQLIYPIVKSYYSQHRQIDVDFIQSAAEACRLNGPIKIKP